MEDEFKTVSEKEIGKGTYTEKRSRFLAFVHHVSSEDEIHSLLTVYRKQYHDARHVCYAWVLGPEGKQYRAVDDGEPSSTAGKPILGQLFSQNLTDVLVIVVRYYGGVNLGTGGLVRAYRTAAAEALEHSAIVVRYVEEQVEWSFPYAMTDRVMRVVRETGCRIVNRSFDQTCQLTLAVRKREAENLRKRLANLENQ